MLRLGWGLALFCYAVLSIWLLRHPPSIPTDDAFFFVNGTIRFSVLEFRPHFPGYPGFIALSKLLYFAGLTAKQAVFYLTLFSALTLPPLSAWAAKTNGASPTGTLLAFAGVLTLPFLPLVSLSMMSDATGIAFFLAALASIGRGHHGFASAFAGMALACRPSFFIPIGLSLFIEWCLKKEARFTMFITTAATLFLFFGAVVLLEGESYFLEALRFTEGHFTVWGNTSFEQATKRDTWLDAATREPLAFITLSLLICTAAYALFKKPQLTPLTIATLSALLWTAFAQNPENLRHVLLPTVLLVIWLASLRARSTRYVLYISVLLQLNLWSQLELQPTSDSPLDRSIGYLEKQPNSLLVTNRGVYYLRDRLPKHQIKDAYYIDGEERLTIQTNSPAWKLTGSTEDIKWCENNYSFGSRTLGERDLHIQSNC
ncbi:hypothetical protein SAMN05444141_101190 [Pseudovibrio denitrificans]|uniref:Dolichyl-phosphate-mannose-protein mannosyltransferase n=1 Tax=Pseudovibrio denitrificans TaxID=258256 RepID=A0A1I6XHP8_9HYPH|nr:hypothetical protein [Pseudovibrio denitrificans]SFT37613.1 hypothetical protein SAMN05444141_101190 [Pseudovibrio denitrificans]